MRLLQRWARTVALPGAVAGMVLAGLIGITTVAEAHQASRNGLAYAVYVHPGDCAAFTPETALASDEATLEVGAPEALQSMSFGLVVEPGLADLVASPHAITIEVHDADVATTVACGNIAGVVDATRLVIPVQLTEDGEIGGVAVVTSTEAGSTQIAVFMVVAASGADAGSSDGDAAVLDTQDADGTPETDDDAEPEGGV